jgi:hypothetical protein
MSEEQDIRDFAPAVLQQDIPPAGRWGIVTMRNLLRGLMGGIERAPAPLGTGRDAKVCIAQGIMFPGPTAGALAAVFALRSIGAIPPPKRERTPEEPLVGHTQATADFAHDHVSSLGS